MRLRNRKTGEIVEYDSVGFRKGRSNGWDDFIPNADSLAALNDVWEDYKPAEPLIKDEKIRKAVRAWWETIPDVITDKRILFKKYNDFAVGVYTIYCGAIYPETLEVGKMYTIAELCGEEEE